MAFLSSRCARCKAPLIRSNPLQAGRSTIKGLESRTLLAVAPVGPSLQLNTLVSTAKDTPAVALDALGNFVSA